jgi:mevalonate kinase
MSEIQASAPGKLILAGEHAAVYGYPALVASLGLRARAAVTVRPERSEGLDAPIAIELPEAGARLTTSWRQIGEETATAREHWRREMESPGSFRPLSRDATALVRLALGEALAARPGSAPPPALDVAVRSEIPLGAGCGSSAAVASSVVAATLTLLDRQCEGDLEAPALDELERVVLEVERRQHGAPSGVDAATVLRGGVLWCHRVEGALLAEPVRAASALSGLSDRAAVTASPLSDLGAFAVLHTGTPRESTGEVVARVRARRDSEPDRIETALRQIADAARRLRSAIEQVAPEDVVSALRKCARGLEALDVVPHGLRRLCRRVEEAGGAAKVSGAGTVTGEAAGVVLVYHPSAAALAELRDTLELGAARWLPDVALGGAGLELST